MMKMTRKMMMMAVPAAVVVLGSTEAQAAPVTNITVKNTRTTSVNLTSTNLSGYLSPIPLSSIYAGGTDSYGSYTGGTVDAGTVYYGGCRFNWSKIQSGTTWIFSLGATPLATCAATATVQNPFTGAYSITLTTK